MLEWLSVYNFALIEQVKIEFSRGFNVLTGETGAGKSILLDAVSTILGARSSIENIRETCDYYRIQALFNIANLSHIQEWLSEKGFEVTESELLITRKLNKNGKNFIDINGVQVTLATLRALGALLVDMHAQNNNQLLVQAGYQLDLLDFFLTEQEQKILKAYKNIFEQYNKAEKDLQEVRNSLRAREQRMDILRWQIQEITNIAPKLNEYEQLELESKRLANLEKIRQNLQEATFLLEKPQGGGILEDLTRLNSKLENLARYEPKFQDFVKSMEDWQYLIQEVKLELLDYYEQSEGKPINLEKIQLRLDELYKLYKKYGSYEATMLFLKAAQEEYSSLETIEENIKGLEAQLGKLQAQLEVKASNLSLVRQKAAEKLSSAVQEHLRDLAMPQAVFKIQVIPQSDFGKFGRDDVQLLFSANFGQQLRPVAKVASGGELSRIFLALKTVLMRNFNYSTMIFDEVDTGVSGLTAQRMAEKLVLISKTCQVICVTHLPPVACMADTHLCIKKYQTTDNTMTQVNSLDLAGKIAEISNMMAGDSQTDLTKDSAAQMLKIAQERKLFLRGY